MSHVSHNHLQLSALDNVRWSTQPIHRWYFMTEGLPIGLVREVLKNSKGPILDPFLGAGTVLTEASLMRKPALGIDVNPFMCFVSRVKTRSYNVSEVISNFRNLAEVA